MAKKLKSPEFLVAEIHLQQSKLMTLKAQQKANDEKIGRLQSTNSNIAKKANNLKVQLDRNVALAQKHGIKF